MASHHSSANELIEKDRASIWHPFTQMKTARPPIPIEKAKGIYLYSPDGRAYLDAISSWWVNLHGHAHPYIIGRMKSQADLLEHVIFADFTHNPAIELATRLLSLLPGQMSKIFFSDNGSTSVEVALKMALHYWHKKDARKKKVVCLKTAIMEILSEQCLQLEKMNSIAHFGVIFLKLCRLIRLYKAKRKNL